MRSCGDWVGAIVYSVFDDSASWIGTNTCISRDGTRSSENVSDLTTRDLLLLDECVVFKNETLVLHHHLSFEKLSVELCFLASMIVSLLI